MPTALHTKKTGTLKALRLEIFILGQLFRVISMQLILVLIHPIFQWVEGDFCR